MISVIGAGPAGSYLSSLLDDEVKIFDYKENIGKPIQCTGVLTNRFQDYIKEKKFVDNKIYNIELNSKNESHIISLKKPEFIINRYKYDNFLLQKAIDKGAKFYPKHQFRDFRENMIYFSNGEKVKTDILIGADGPLSKVNRISNIQNKKHWVAKQIKVKYKTELDTYKVYFNIPDFFSWIVPEDENTARIGCASSSNINQHFDNFMRKLNVKKENILEYQGALIPQYNPMQKYQKGNVYLIGDAASLIKNISGGGLLPAIKSSHALANSLNKNKDYKKELSKILLKSLNLNYLTRKVLNKFNEKDYDKLIKLLKEYKLDKLDRDNLRYTDLIKPKIGLLSLKALIRNI
ncbi:NAD(P)/FAD-dependent oxidoreductase [Candidatus Woesearchaeota archaeon]|nr:NAD(P)/FAD-dependent oxidoreductase [Candidatus Woesearchaeota archaeon]